MEKLASKAQYEETAEILLGISTLTGINIETVMYSLADYVYSISNYAKLHCISHDEARKYFEESGRFDMFLADLDKISQKKGGEK